VPEMEVFAKEHGFIFRCHEINHCHRKESVSYCTFSVRSKTVMASATGADAA
jgi:hypothetical protein